MKRIVNITMAAVLFVTGCMEGDYGLKPADPQQWGPEEQVTVEGSVTATAVAAMNLATVETETVSVATCNYEEVEGAESYDFQVVLTAAGKSTTFVTDKDMKVAVEDLQSIVNDAYGTAVQERTLNVECLVSAMIGTQSFVFKSAPVELKITPKSMSPVILYCKNPDNWTSANLYGWDTEGINFGNWPGIVSEKSCRIGGIEWFYWEFAPALAGTPAGGLIFSGVSGQTVNIEGKTLDGSMFFVLGEKNSDNQYTYDMIDAPSIKITYTNPNGWTNVNVYAWGAWNSAGWPGVAMTKNTQGVWEYEIPYAEYYGKEGQMIIFNNGDGSQTENLGPYVIDKDLEFTE